MNIFRKLFGRKPKQPLEPLIPGDEWIYNKYDGSPWPLETFNVKILDVKDGWVRYWMHGNCPDNRKPEDLFRKLYRKA